MVATKDPIDRSQPHSCRGRRSSQGFYTPFVDLDQYLRQCSDRPKASPPPEKTATFGAVEHEDSDMLFLDAMAGVKRFCSDEPRRIPPGSPVKRPPRFMEEEEAEVRRHLCELVRGEAPFELWCSDEYVDGAVVGLSPAIVNKLRKGVFSYQDYVDLHGCKRDEARERVNRFVVRSFARRHRCVLIVSGRGLNSREREPVLKQELVRWLTHAPLRRMVLAFASARACDGGAGAFYVLLRRQEGRAPFLLPAR